MNVETVQKKCHSVVERWKRAYPVNLLIRDGRLTNNILEELQASDLSKEAIDRIIGNTTWTEVYCSECDESVERIVNFLGSMDVCESCLRKALKLLEEDAGVKKAPVTRPACAESTDRT